MYLGVHAERLATIGEIARAYSISENHSMKVVYHLAQRVLLRAPDDPRVRDYGEPVREIYAPIEATR